MFTGKLLGFIDRKQFYNLHKTPSMLAKKVGTGGIKTLENIARMANFKQHRLVLSTLAENSSRQLLITGEITELKSSSVDKKITEITMVDAQSNFIHIENDGNV